MSEPTILLTGSEAAIKNAVEELKKENANTVVIQSETATIAIKKIREVIKEVGYTSLAGKRTVIIFEAEKLTTPSANALLKVLEEPPASTSFVLTTSWPKRLLPTIKSRCQQTRLTETEDSSKAKPEVSISFQLGQKESFSTEELDQIAAQLQDKLQSEGPSSDLRRAYMRLRDYYFIKASRGNTKLAQDVLIASLPNK